MAKNHEGLVGIKILKILSLKNWRKVKKDNDIVIYKGDFCRKCGDKQKGNSDELLSKKKRKKGKKRKIESEEDLYDVSEGSISDSEFDKSSRLIKPDNIVGLGFSQYSFVNTLPLVDETRTENTVLFSWNYQLFDNIWVEGLYGRTLIDNLPAENSATLINNFTVRAKYTLELPLYSYAMPYIGYQLNVVSSPDAGADPSTRSQELAFIESLETRSLIFGVTILRRLVPGWFLKADLGTDLVGVGFSVEF